MSTEQVTEIALAINRVMKLDAQDQSSMLEVIADYFTLPTLDDEPEFDEDNFDELDDYDGDSSGFITSNLADRTMRELSEQNAAGKKTQNTINKSTYNYNRSPQYLASLEDDGVYLMDEGHRTDDGGHDGMGVMRITVGNVKREAIL